MWSQDGYGLRERQPRVREGPGPPRGEAVFVTLARTLARIRPDRRPATATKKRKARKLPRGAFGCFLARKPKELTQICEVLPSRKGMKLAGEWWNQMSTSDREHYKKIYEELKGQHEEAKFQKQLAKKNKGFFIFNVINSEHCELVFVL